MSEFSPKELQALEHVIKQKNLEPYFFEKLIQKKDARWLNLLKQRGFFDKSNIPVISEGNYIEEWNVLNYIASIVEELVHKEDKDSIEYILEILLQAAETSKNYRVFNQSVEILKSIAVNYIPDKYIDDFLDYWLTCEFGRDHILKEIELKLLPHFYNDSAKLFSIFKKFLVNSIEHKSNHEYLLGNLIENKQMLSRIIDVKPIEAYELFIYLIEKECFIAISNRDIEQQTFSIRNIHNKYFCIPEFKNSVQQEFKSREEDLNYIINNLKLSIEGVNNKTLDRMSKLLYGGLFDKDAFESIFEKREYRLNPTDYLISIIKVSLTECSIKETILATLVKNMIRNKYDLVKKLGIFIIIQKWSELKDTFFNLLVEKTDLFDYIFRHYIFDEETKYLFNLLTDEIDVKYITLLESIINKGEYIFHEREGQLHQLKWEQKRYKALDNITIFKKKLEQTRKRTNIDIELSPAIKMGEFGFVKQLSPYSQEEILKMSLEELINEMLNFKEDSVMYTGLKQVSYRGFGEELKKVILSFPDYFIDDLDKFNNIQYEFAYYLLDGFNVLMKQNTELNYHNVLDFIVLYTSEGGFWKNSLKSEKENEGFMGYEETIKQFLDFITDLISNDEINFTDVHLDLVIKFLKKCQDEINFGIIEEVLFSNDDMSFYTLNSLGGKYVRALLELGLKIKRISFPRYQSYWEEDIKPIYEDLLVNNCIDSYAILGEFISNFSYIDENWTKEKIKDIDFKNEMWKYFMSGYLATRTVYYEFYQLMKENYLKALEYDGFIDKKIKEKIGNHIVIGYINGFEEDHKVSLLEKALDIWDIKIIETMIRYAYNIEKIHLAKGVSRKDAKDKVLKFWNEIILIYSNKGSELDAEEASLTRHALQLIDNFTLINDSIFHNLTFSFKYARNSFELYDVVEYCERMIEKNEIDDRTLNIKLIFELFIQCTPSYPEDKIKKLLEYLNINDESEKLGEILVSYTKKTNKSFVVNYIYQLLKEK